jgi:two-component system, NarL family, sensor kinase
MIKYLLISSFFLAKIPVVFAQEMYKDSIRVISKLPDGPAKVNRLNELAKKNQFADPVQALAITQTAFNIAKKIKYNAGMAAGYGFQASMLFYEMKLDSCRLLVDKAYELIKGNKDLESKNQVAMLMNTYGAIHQQQQNYDSAVEKYLQAAKIFSATNNESKIIYTYYNLSVLYGFLDDTLKTAYYARQTNDIAKKTNDTTSLLRSLIVLTNAFVTMQQYDSVSILSRQGLQMAYRQNAPYAIGKFHEMLGIYFRDREKKYDSAVAHFNTSLEYLKKINSRYDIALVLKNMGNAYLNSKDYPGAVNYLEQSSALARSLSLDQVLAVCLTDLVEAEEKLNNPDKALEYLKEFVSVKDSLQKRNNLKQVNELEAKYQTQKKETMLIAQQAKIQQKNILNYVLAGSALLLILISVLTYRNYRHKQHLQQQRITELETQQQLTATEAVLKGEEQERTRLAKDLHDGLGGMLSGIKYSFNTMKGNLVMTPENAQLFERSMDMLDSSIKEMRRVAHNMMPEALVKFGLDTALKDFCNDINSTGALQVSYQSFGLENLVLEQTMAITIYRIVQELINNTMKHAAAKNAIVQVTKTGQIFSVTVEDDGKGFDTALLEHFKYRTAESAGEDWAGSAGRGMGWSNIQNRVEFLKGTLDIKSRASEGTSVHIELNLA